MIRVAIRVVIRVANNAANGAGAGGEIRPVVRPTGGGFGPSAGFKQLPSAATRATIGGMNTLETLPFDNRYARLPDDFYQRVDPTPFTNPHLVAVNHAVAALIGLSPEQCRRPEFVQYFCGARRFAGAEPLAALYAGNQFGSWVPQLGDGRAILLGEVNGPHGHWDIQLKGAGKTAFSRMGDGRAVLRSVVREYLCSEAMHGLGIPTTRALCIIGSDEPVPRERLEPGAMMARLAPSHVRFGTFQVFSSRKQVDHLKTLADHVLEHHFPELREDEFPYVALLAEVARRTGELVAGWQGVGFVHGVLNSDNMSILGLTLDYGPFVFIDRYEHAYVRNHTDRTGFYAYNRQPEIGHYNVYLLATAMLPLMTPEQAQDALDRYKPAYRAAYQRTMRAKLGLTGARQDDDALFADLFDLMERGQADFTRMFRGLAQVRAGAAEPLPPACKALLNPLAAEPAAAWFARYADRLKAEGRTDGERAAAMNRVNPLYILRTHLAQAAIEAAEGHDFGEIDRLYALLADPFTPRPGMERYAAPPAADEAACELSCSS